MQSNSQIAVKIDRQRQVGAELAVCGLWKRRALLARQESEPQHLAAGFRPAPNQKVGVLLSEPTTTFLFCLAVPFVD